MCFSVHIPFCLLFHSGPENGDSYVALENLIYWICNQKKTWNILSRELVMRPMTNRKPRLLYNVLLMLLYHVACHQIASIGI
jgi:hypothetical protein